MRFPNTVDDLIDQLDKSFPEPTIGPSDTMETIQYHSGQRSVIRYLRQWRSSKEAPPAAPRGSGRPTR